MNIIDIMWAINFSVVIIVVGVFVVIDIHSAVDSNGFCESKGFDYYSSYDRVHDKDYYECCTDLPGKDVCTWIEHKEERR